MDSRDELLILFLTKVNIRSCALVLVPQHDICSKNFAHDVTPYIKTSNSRERGKECLIIILWILREIQAKSFSELHIFNMNE